ncbi:putative copper resistance-associated P-type ATPase [Cladophialophora carrionii]|uniref:Putative copper resistance-associated P-type ATPase n=1 Tax=Cladophialophora carrionii TaxID=86049 RepID=A0A1C1CKU1_9EURO|nr:putative copper resistance-associated P-type ATPase [Cladophialophora carrionii]
MAYTTTFLVSNIHCPSCVSYVQDILRGVSGIQSVHVSLIDHLIRVRHADDSTRDLIISELIKAASEVEHVTTVDPNGVQSHEFDVSQRPLSSRASRSTWLTTRAQRKHIENCNACQRENGRKSRAKGGWSSLARKCRSSPSRKPPTNEATAVSNDTLVDEKPALIDIDGSTNESVGPRYAATVSIGGMTCASCTSTITKALHNLSFVETAQVSLMTNTARVVYSGPKSNSDKVVAEIEDVGYEAAIDGVEPLGEEKSTTEAEDDNYKITLSIEGMTCGSCVGTITRGLRELPFVKDINIDLVGNRGVISFSGKKNLDILLEKIDDLGYDATVVKLEDAATKAASPKQERTVQLKVDGMYCDHCPDNIRRAIKSALPTGQDSVYTIIQLPSLDDPIITITYRPSSRINVRSFVAAIDASHEALSATVYHPPTLEERSRRLQRKEMRHILWRLLFTGIVAIPTLIIGVIYMNLVPKSNPTRQWWEQPILAGQAMRMEWALFFMTTPVMFFGTDLFHARAYKEIKAMWRRNSKIPILRRFYRFGSMNLLISAGTAVAYFSSLAVLIMDATDSSHTMRQSRSSDTYFDTVTFLTFFILIGRFLEAYSKTKTGDAVAMLSKLRPSEAVLVEDKTIRTIPVDQLEAGDLVQIAHGVSPPTDGTIEQQGIFLFDESSLTGESKPVRKTFGDQVYTGSVNVSEPVRIRVNEVGGTSMLDRIVNVVREGQAKRAPIERIADILTGYFVPVITLIAIVTWVIWLALGLSGVLPRAWLDVNRGGWPFWSLEFAIAVFVVACPCGIGLAAPTALFVGGGLAAKYGILVQGGGEAFQEASKLNAIVFDKTGTLTEGQMRVTDFELIQNGQSNTSTMDENVILAMARNLEESSTHPIAKAIASYCAEKASNVMVESEDIKEIPGQGLTGRYFVRHDSASTKYEVALGNERLLQLIDCSNGGGAKPAPVNEATKVTVQDDFYLNPILRKHQSLGHSTAIFAVRQSSEDFAKGKAPSMYRAVALFAIADPVRPEAPSVLHLLRDAGLEVHMCTGDNQTTALAIASQLAIPASNVRAGVLPQDKAAYIRELEGVSSTGGPAPDGRKIIAFVGDGTNDTPALSAADVSIALSSGSDVAITTASFILLNSDLNTILSLVRLANRVFLRVKLNFAWAAVYNLCLVPVAAGVFFPIGATDNKAGWRLSPVWASVAMAASSVSVVMSSLALRLPELELRRWRRKK